MSLINAAQAAKILGFTRSTTAVKALARAGVKPAAVGGAERKTRLYEEEHVRAKVGKIVPKRPVNKAPAAPPAVLEDEGLRVVVEKLTGVCTYTKQNGERLQKLEHENRELTSAIRTLSLRIERLLQLAGQQPRLVA